MRSSTTVQSDAVSPRPADNAFQGSGEMNIAHQATMSASPGFQEGGTTAGKRRLSASTPDSAKKVKNMLSAHQVQMNDLQFRSRTPSEAPRVGEESVTDNGTKVSCSITSGADQTICMDDGTMPGSVIKEEPLGNETPNLSYPCGTPVQKGSQSSLSGDTAIRKVCQSSSASASPIRKGPEPTPGPLPMVIRVPGDDGVSSLLPIDELPLLVHRELQRRHTESWTRTITLKQQYCRMTKAPALASLRPFCLREQLSCSGNTLMRFGKPIPPQSFSQGGRLKLEADDKCIEMGHPCLHVVVYEGAYALCLLPLPKSVRGAKTWKELGFWVHD